MEKPPKSSPMDKPKSSPSGLAHSATKRPAWAPPAPSNWSELLTITFQRRFVGDVGIFMGRCFRSPITGLVRAKDAGRLPNFCLVDLLQRGTLPSSVQQLASDPFLFKPVILKYRSWFYHDDFNKRKVRINAGDGRDALQGHLDDMVTFAVTQKSIDASVIVGRFSPVAAFAMVGFIMCFTSDSVMMVAALSVVWFQVMVSVLLNSPESYQWERLITLPLRLALACWIITRMPGLAGFAVVAGTVAVLAIALDLVFGDLGIPLSHGFRCSYEILRILPKRVYVCRRHGGMQDTDFLESRTWVNESIIGFNMGKMDVLIADVHGLLCELRPLKQDDWLRAAHEQMQNGTVLPYIGLDVFRLDDYGRLRPNEPVKGLGANKGSSSPSSFASPQESALNSARGGGLKKARQDSKQSAMKSILKAGDAIVAGNSLARVQYSEEDIHVEDMESV